MARKQRSDSVKGMVEAMQAAISGDVEPPAYVRMRPGDEDFWKAIVRARARAEWTESDLVHAANLARCMADIERIAGELESEPDIVENARGTPVPNPKHALQETLSRRAMSLTRILQMQSASSGKQEDKAKARAAERSARDVARALEDELIPTA